MAKRSLGELNQHQRHAVQYWANQMGVTEAHAVNWLNRLDDRQGASVWDSIDRIAQRFEQCGCADC
jgi:hypothetical protein